MYKQWGKDSKYKGDLRKEKGDFLCEVSAETKFILAMPNRCKKTRNAKH